MKKNVMRKVLACLLIGSCISVAGCGANSSETNYETSPSFATAAPMATDTADMDYYDDAVAEEAYDGDMMDNSGDYALTGEGVSDVNANGGSNSSASSLQYEDKLIYTANLSIETKDFDATYKTLIDLIDKYNGRIESENLDATNLSYSSRNYDRDGYYNTKTDYLVIRIPSASFKDFLGSDESLGNVIQKSQNLDNITQNYYSSKTQVELLEGQLDYYKYQLGLIEEQLKTCEDYEYVIGQMVELEDRIIEVQSQINSYTNSIKTMDMDVAYSTINLTLTEVKEYTDLKNIQEEEPDTFVTRFKNTVKNSINIFLKILEGILTILIYLLPYMLVVGIILFIILKICKASAKKKNAKKMAMNNMNAQNNSYVNGVNDSNSNNEAVVESNDKAGENNN